MSSERESQPVPARYAAGGVAVRGDLIEAHDALLEYIAGPGNWLTGAERVALAIESRQGERCALCAERRAALSPEHPTGGHTTVTALRAPLVEMAHRIRTDPPRLSHAWQARMLAEGLSEGEYVEAVGIISLTAGIDAFCRSLGVAPFALPAPSEAPPSRHRPEGLRCDEAWVAMLAPGDCTGPEADLYPDIPVVPNIARALSQIPGHARVLQALTRSHYVDLADLANPTVGRALDRTQIELVAARVSAMNECFY